VTPARTAREIARLRPRASWLRGTRGRVFARLRGFRSVGIAGPGFRGPIVGRGVRVAGFRGGGFRRGWGGWGWGVPLAGFGLGLGYYGYSDPCVVWDGYDWVNICY
jgi:hypothetical protein